MKTPHEIDHHVYPDSRYTEGNSPFCIYIPCKEVMLKLMRACIKVTEPDNLWILKCKEKARVKIILYRSMKNI